ncbi:MAG: phosphoribosylamine--glycine ligase [Bdellovibrionales bacterium]|nr:phosphoribosylamine--glycine ligase [Bdellovibrionales bacterium]
MKTLIIGSGGREHALFQAVSEGGGNAYFLPERKSLPTAGVAPSALLKDWSALSDWLKKEKIRLVIIGPEQPLVEGLGDFLKKQGFFVFGPSASAARLEGSKLFAKEFMKAQNIPTAPFQVVHSLSETLKASENFSPPYVLKADGLAGGKGVFVCQTVKELEDKAKSLFEDKILGSAGEVALLEEFQKGVEVSVFILTNGEDYCILPMAQDYKRLGEKNTGPNTGGMGATAPLSLPEKLMEDIENSIIKPSVQGLKKNHYGYCGVLYIGLMVGQKGPRVLEYNVRFGDPEAQVLLPLLDGSWCEVFYQVSQGKLPSLNWKNIHSACVVLAAGGYPGNPLKGEIIKGFIYHKTPHSYFLHAGVGQNEEGQWIVNGGRVLNSVAVGQTAEQALKRAYEQMAKISWEGLHYRKDIGSAGKSSFHF